MVETGFSKWSQGHVLNESYMIRCQSLKQQKQMREMTIVRGAPSGMNDRNCVFNTLVPRTQRSLFRRHIDTDVALIISV